MRKLDSYAHIFPPAYFDRMRALAKDKGAIKRWLNIPVLYDLQARLAMMERFPGYQQVLTLSNPPITASLCWWSGTGRISTPAT